MIRSDGENVETAYNSEMSPHHITKDILQANRLLQHIKFILAYI